MTDGTQIVFEIEQNGLSYGGQLIPLVCDERRHEAALSAAEVCNVAIVHGRL
jgi:hypothetical protein